MSKISKAIAELHLSKEQEETNQHQNPREEIFMNVELDI